MKRALRTLVLKTEAFPPLGGLYRALYHIAVGVVTILIRAHPEFHALFLRGSYARGDFRPGRSDLDFVFVTRKGLDDNTLFRLLSRTRRAFSLLKAVVPFLGEFEILEEETFRSWLAHNPDRKELRSPGRDPLADLEDPRELELLRKDLTDFVYLWQPNLTVWNQSELDRLFDKTTRLCGLSTPSLSNTTYRRWQQTAYLLQHFDQACRSWRPARGAARVAMVPNLKLPTHLSSYSEQLRSFVQSPFDEGDCFAVFKSGLVSPDLLAVCGSSQNVPRFFTPESLRFYLAQVSPLHAVSLERDRRVWGTDIVEELSLEDGAFRQGMRYAAAAMLSSALTKPVEVELAEVHLVGWYLRYKRYLEDGVRESYFHEVLQAYSEEKPRYYEKVKNVLARPDALSLFGLYRRAAQDISKALLH